MLIPSKLSRPVRLQNAIIRDRLLQRLQTALDYRLRCCTVRQVMARPR